MTTLLLPEKPISILPGLAVAAGLNEAIFLQQLHYWLNGSEDGKKYGRNHEGHAWVYNDYNGWKEQSFPFWSVSTIRRVVAGLEKQGYVIAEIEMSSDFPGGRRKWYRINYEALKNIGSVQNEQTGLSKMNTPSVQNEPSYNIDTETTTETTKDSAEKPQSAPEAKPRKRDEVFDMVAEVWFGVQRDTSAFAALGGRIGPIVSWLKGNTVKLRGKGQKPIPGCTTPYTRDLLSRARQAWIEDNRGATLITAQDKVIAYLDKWGRAQVQQPKSHAGPTAAMLAMREAQAVRNG